MFGGGMGRKVINIKSYIQRSRSASTTAERSSREKWSGGREYARSNLTGWLQWASEFSPRYVGEVVVKGHDFTWLWFSRALVTTKLQFRVLTTCDSLSPCHPASDLTCDSIYAHTVTMHVHASTHSVIWGVRGHMGLDLYKYRLFSMAFHFHSGWIFEVKEEQYKIQGTSLWISLLWAQIMCLFWH